MTQTPLAFTAPVLLVGGAAVDRAEFSEATAFTSHIVAVDSGADHLASWGAVPDVVIGDMDSIRTHPPQSARMFRIEEQDSTDLEKALRGIDAPLFIGIGFLRGRVDHTLAAMHALVRFSEKPVILIGPEDVVFASPPAWRSRIAPGDRVSFYPVTRTAALGSDGLRWPIDGLVFEGGAQIGASNEAVSPDIAARFAGPGCITILPRNRLAETVESLT